MPASLASRLRANSGALRSTSQDTVGVDFGDWAPDLPDFANPGAIVCNNVLPAANSYLPARDLVDVSLNALESTCLGAVTARDASNNVYVYAATATKLYELLDNTFNDESKAGGYNTATDDVWEFAVWDREQKVIATNFTDPVQAIDIGKGASVDFADLITSTQKPKAKHVGVVRNFLVLGHTEDATDGVKTQRVWWSAIGNEENFDPAAATQSDFSDLDTGGWVQKIVGGAEYGVIFQESTIRRMEYEGSPIIFDLPAVDRRRGTPIPNSVVAQGRLIYYISEEGFFVFNGSSSEPIGVNRVDRTFWAQFDLADRKKVSASIDVLNKLVCWAFPANGGDANGNPNKIFCYKWDTGRWSEIDIDLDWIFQSQNQGYTLEGLDAVSTNIDTLEPSLDSDVWKGGKIYSGAFTTAHKLGSFDGATLQATLDTREQQFTQGRASYIDSVRALVQVEPSSARSAGNLGIQIAVAGRDSLEDSVVFDAPVLINAEGLADADNQARYQRFRTIIPAGAQWRHAQGLAVNKSARGRYNGASVA
ncbi:MAG: hypothetical protein ACR2RF_32335 [Geminicoccaceae bacterium]